MFLSSDNLSIRMQEQFQIDPTERVRLLEARYDNLRDRVLIVNQNMIAEYKKLHQEIKEVNQDVRELKADIFEIKNSVTKIAEELKFFAKKEQLKVLEKYIEFWSPLKFVTDSQLQKALEKRGDKDTRTKKRSLQSSK